MDEQVSNPPDNPELSTAPRPLEPFFNTIRLLPEFLPGRVQDAYSSIRGFTYQINTTIIRWLSLNPGEILELERGEDIDLLFPSERGGIRILEQVKHLEEKVSFRSAPILEFLCNAIDHRFANPSLCLGHVLTTTAYTRKEKGIGYSILDKWNTIKDDDCKTLVDNIRRIFEKKIRNKNIKEEKWNALQDFFSAKNQAGDILSFIKSVKFRTGADPLPDTTRKIFLLLQEKNHAEDAKVAKEKYDRLLSRLCQHSWCNFVILAICSARIV